MSALNFQTVTLKRGRHVSPDRGVCVMELASMLAGERFTDRPACVSRLIGAFMRAYNDRVGRRERQDLYACAAAVVGTRGLEDVEEARRRHCVAVVDDLERMLEPSLFARLRAPAPDRVREAFASGPLDDAMWLLAALMHAAGEPGHARALALVDELVTLGSPAPPAPPAQETAVTTPFTTR